MRGSVSLGLGANLGQFTLLVVVNAFVGAMIGLERTVVPLMAEQEFGIRSATIISSFIISFGLVKAVANLFAGRISERIGRKAVLVVGWLIGLPVPILLMLAPSWGWVVFANVLLGVNQGLCWSTTVIMKIDLIGPARRGLAMGINEFAGYGAVAAAALASGYIATATALRPQPFYLGIAFALLGLILSVWFVRDTAVHVALEAEQHAQASRLHPSVHSPMERALSDTASTQITVDTSTPRRTEERPSTFEMISFTTWKDRAMLSVSQGGFVNNLNDGMAWGLFPLFFAAGGLAPDQIGVLVAAYPATWGLLQIGTGALSDLLGRKWLIVLGMWIQAAAIVVIALSKATFLPALLGSAMLGVGTALVYPTFLAAIGDVAHPTWRASAVGVYRFWRDSGYAAGALAAGMLADYFGLTTALFGVAVMTFASGGIVAALMYETLSTKRSGRKVL